jgi:predicted signal transduction protein with EAL and GGDEF domain
MAKQIVQRLYAEQGMVRPLSHLALHDGLTDLPNRMHWRRKIDELTSRPQSSTCSIAVLAMDLSGFKQINDTFGHMRSKGSVSSRPAASSSAATMCSTVSTTPGGDRVARSLLKSIAADTPLLKTGSSAVIGPDTEYIRAPLFDTATTIFVPVDVAALGSARVAINTAGHYARPDVFELRIETRPKRSAHFDV